MKTFHYERGHEATTTLTVAELMQKLSEFPPEMPVFAEWESVYGPIRPDRFEVKKDVNWGKVEDACDVLLINADTY